MHCSNFCIHFLPKWCHYEERCCSWWRFYWIYFQIFSIRFYLANGQCNANLVVRSSAKRNQSWQVNQFALQVFIVNVRQKGNKDQTWLQLIFFGNIEILNSELHNCKFFNICQLWFFCFNIWIQMLKRRILNIFFLKIAKVFVFENFIIWAGKSVASAESLNSDKSLQI